MRWAPRRARCPAIKFLDGEEGSRRLGREDRVGEDRERRVAQDEVDDAGVDVADALGEPLDEGPDAGLRRLRELAAGQAEATELPERVGSVGG